MGRHSIPDPRDSPDKGLPEEPPTQRFGRQRPAEPGYGERDYGRPAHRESEYDRPAYREPSYSQSGYPEGDDYDDDDYDEPDYDETDYDEPEAEYAQSRRAQHSGEWEGGEWTGSHRAVATGRRGVSVGVIVALVAVVVIVGAFILWRFFGDALSHRSDALAARCVSGELAVAVVADPSISDQIQKLADTYNKSAEPVADKDRRLDVALLRRARSELVVQ